MYEEIISIGVKLLVGLLALAGTYLISKAREFLKKRLDEQEMAIFDSLVRDFCEAAEQQYSLNDPGGEKRLKYVEELLVEAGYTITEFVKAKIEAEVFKINLKEKK